MKLNIPCDVGEEEDGFDPTAYKTGVRGHFMVSVPCDGEA